MTDPSLDELARALAEARQEVRNLIVMQLRPGQTKHKLAVLKNLERSARAEVKLRVVALEYAKAQRRMPPVQLEFRW